jgi:hypothetical protein
MKNFISFLLFFFPIGLFSQFSESFNDGLFRNKPSENRPVEWTGDVDKFVVNELLQLQLNASGADAPAQLKTASTISANTYWEWWMKMDFNPTSSNYAKIFLYSDEEELTGELNGLFVRVGYSNKNVALILSQKGKNNKTLIEGIAKRLDKSSVSIHLKATFDKKGLFSLYSKTEDEPDFVLEGSCNISEIFESQYFGVVCYFTSTRSKSFYFDDFQVRELTDDEQGPGDPDPIYLDEGDVIFSEIMANPESDNPEYIELYNAGNKSFNLKDHLYYYGDKSYKLPEGTINPGEYFVLCKTTATNTFPEGTKVFGVTSFPTLANGGKLLMFSTDKEKLISWFEYSDKMYGDNEKKSGGWSLECIDFSNKSNMALNWIGSGIAGGTPGIENSVKNTNPDVEIPIVTGVQTLENNELKITFSKYMNQTTLSNVNSIQISNNQYIIENLQANFPYGTELNIRLSKLPPQGEIIELGLNGIKDLSGFGLADKTLMIGSGNEAAPNEIIINEIMFNPPTDSEEYLELYNNSDKTIDLQFLSYTTRKSSDGTLNKLYSLSDKATLFRPGEYLVITKSRDLVCSFFTCQPELFYVELSVTPALVNTSGCIVLLNNKTEEIIDEVAYDENWHSEGISNKKGISLERGDFNKPSNDPTNWHSASSDSGFGTPGYQNSQFKPDGIDESISILYPEFEMDNYKVHYRLNKSGYRCRAYLYNSAGRTVSVIADNKLLGTEGDLVWNSKDSSNKSISAGIYVVYVEVYDMSGEVKKFKKPVVMN